MLEPNPWFAGGPPAIARLVLRIVPDAVVRVLELQRDGLSVREIAAVVDAEGRHTKRGGRWHPTTVQRILQRHRLDHDA